MKNYVTREYFDGVVATLRQDIRDILKIVSVTKEGMGAMQVSIEELCESVKTVQTAVLELTPTEDRLRNLIGQLQAKGLALDESRIFTSKQ